MTHVDAVVYEADGTTVLGRLSAPLDLSALEEYAGLGGGSVTLHADDPQVAWLADRNVVKVRIDGTPVAAWVVRRREPTVVGPDAEASRTVTVSGPSVDTWLAEALVYANQQHPYSGSTRWFSYGSPAGDWFVEAEWGTPQIVRQLRAPDWYDSRNPWAKGPTNWPTQDEPAAWIWATPDAWQDAPAGDCYFRRTFTTPTGGRDYRLFVTADNACQVLLDGQPLATVYDADAHARAYSCDFTLDAGEHVLAFKARNTGGPAGLLAHLFAVARAGTDQDQLFHVARTGDDGWRVCAYPRREPGWSFGGVLEALVGEAQGRNVAGLSNVSGLSFDALTDTVGTPWGRRFYRFGVGDTLAQVAEAEQDYGVRVRVDPDTLELHAYNGRTGQAATVQLDAARNLISLSEQSESDLATALLVRTDSSWGGAVAASEFGRIESYLDVSGLSPADAADLSRAVLERSRIPQESVRVAYVPTAGDVPWQDYGVGEAVRVPSGDGYRARLVVSLAVSLDESGEATFEVELDTPYRDLLERLARRMSRGNVDDGPAAGRVQPRTADSTLDDPVGGGLPGGATDPVEWPGLDDGGDTYFPGPGDPTFPGDPSDPDNPNFPADYRPDAEWPAANIDTEQGYFGADGIWREGTSGGWYDADGTLHTGHPAGWYGADDTLRTGHPAGWYDEDGTFVSGAQDGEGTLDSAGRWRQTGAEWTDGNAATHDGSPGGWWDSSGAWHGGSDGRAGSGYFDADGVWHEGSSGGWYSSGQRFVEGAQPGEGTLDGDGIWTQTGASWTDGDGGSHDGSPGGWYDSGGVWHPGVDGRTEDDDGNLSDGAGPGYWDAGGVWHPLAEATDYPQTGEYGVPGDPGNVGAGTDYDPFGSGPYTGTGGDAAWDGDPSLSGDGFIPVSPVLDDPAGSDPWAPPSDPTGDSEGRWDVGTVSEAVATDAIAVWESYGDTVYVCLTTAEPERTSGAWGGMAAVELDGSGYARQEVAWDGFDAASGLAPVVRASNVDVTFGPNPGPDAWGTVSHVVLIVGPSIRSVIPLATPIVVQADMTFTIPAGNLQIACGSVAD